MNGAASYVYDPVGNRTQKTSTLPGYPGGLSNYNANDQLVTDTYDANGNTTASTGQGYVYDFENHLIQAGGVTYTYDGDGNRISKTAGGVTTTYLVDRQSPTGYPQVVQEWPSPGTLMGYAYGLEQISRQRNYYDYKQGQWVNEQVYYVHDGHGSVRALTDATGAVTDTYDYDAFGNLIHSTGTTPNNYLFAGEQFDPDLGLYYNRARYMNTSTGRFWSMDKIDGQTLEKFSSDHWEAGALLALKPSSSRIYKFNLDKYIISALGSHRLCDVNRAAIQQLLLSMRGKGYSASTLHSIRITVAKVLQTAVENGYLEHNPAHGIKIGERESKKQRTLLGTFTSSTLAT